MADAISQAGGVMLGSLPDLGTIIIVVLITLAVGLGFIFFMIRKKPKWTIKVKIFENRAGNVVEDTDMAQRVKTTEKGVVIKLKRRAVELDPIPLSYFYLNKMGRSTLYLKTEDNEKYTPSKIKFGGKDDDFLDEKAWDVVDYRTAVKLKDLFHKSGFMEKYGQILSVMILFMMVLAVVWIIFQNMQTALDKAVSVSDAMNRNAQAVQDLSKALLQAVQALKSSNTVINNGAPPFT